ncbi:MAG TPA: hypothetical protein VGH19_03085 [Verrucomicrobiae bacterium]
MSRWKSNFNNLQISEKTNNCLNALKTLSLDGSEQGSIQEYERLLKVLNALQSRFSKIDVELYSQHRWNQVSNWLNNLLNGIQQFAARKRISHLHEANSAADAILDELKSFGSAETVEEFKSIADANAQFQQKIVEELDRVKGKSNDIKSQLDSLSRAITDGKTRLDEHTNTIQQQKARLDQSIAEFQSQFSQAQEKRNVEFAAAIKQKLEEHLKQLQSFEDTFAARSQKHADEYTNFFSTAKSENTAHLEFIASRKEEIDKIFGAIGSTSFSGNFKNTADIEGKAANLWRWIAIGLMTAMIAVACIAFYFSIKNPTDMTVFLFRMGTVVILAIPAAYAANESSKHRERERLNRRFFLELASIDAYLVLLPEEQRNAIKGKLAERFFGAPESPASTGDVTQKDMFGVLTNVLNNLTKAK